MAETLVVVKFTVHWLNVVPVRFTVSVMVAFVSFVSVKLVVEVDRLMMAESFVVMVTTRLLVPSEVLVALVSRHTTCSLFSAVPSSMMVSV